MSVPRLPNQSDRAWLQFLKRIHASLDHHSMAEWGKSKKHATRSVK